MVKITRKDNAKQVMGFNEKAIPENSWFTYNGTLFFAVEWEKNMLSVIGFDERSSEYLKNNFGEDNSGDYTTVVALIDDKDVEIKIP